jgi:outer membrane putative beta-barrel porin/alpha-amylase/thrombospondin type 3 repeat protein
MIRRALVIAAVLLAPLAAHAQSSRSTGFDAENFHPAITSGGYFSVDGAFVAPHLGFSAGLWLSYAHDPLVLRRGNAVAGEIIVRQLGMDLVGSFALLDRLEIGLDLPFFPYQVNDTNTVSIPNLAAGGVGDLALEVKGLLWNPRWARQRFGLAAILGATFPTGNSASFMGQGSVTGRFRLVAEYQSRWVHGSVEAGVVARGGRDFADLHVGSQFQYGVALAAPLPRGFAIIGEVRGLVGIEFPKGFSLSSAEAPAELAAGLRWRARFGLELDAAVGVGLSRGYGVPDRARAIFGVKYVMPERRRIPPPPPHLAPPPVSPPVAPPPPPPDADEDGVPDDVDQCPTKPGAKEFHGCPPPDRDHDGVPDFKDNCPDVYNPDQKDEDHNGIGDACQQTPVIKPYVPPPAPQPPPFTYKYLGSFGPQTNLLAAFSNNGEIVNARVGDTIDNKFIVRAIGIESVDIGYIGFPPDVKTRVPLGQ